MSDKKRVVVIDDSPIVRKMAEVALEEEGYEVYLAEDGEEGLKITQDVTPSVILVDFIMPKMSGYQFCQAIKDNENLKDIPIILITGKGEDVGKKFLEKFGVIDYFIKPFKSADLVDKVNSIIQMQKTMFQSEETISQSVPEQDPISIDFFKSVEGETFQELQQPETVEQEPISIEFPEPVEGETFQELQQPEIVEQEPISFEFTQPVEIETFQELQQPETVEQEPVSIEFPEPVEIENLQTSQLPFGNQKERVQMETVDVNYIESTVERIAKKFLQDEFQFTIQKSISDVLKQTGLIKATDILLSGDIAIFTIKDILHLVANRDLTAKLSILSDSLIADIYISEGNLIFSSSNKQVKHADYEKIQISDISNPNDLTEDMKYSIKENIYDTLCSAIQLESGSFSIEKITTLDNLKYIPIRLGIPNSLIEASRKVKDSVFNNIYDEKTIFFKLFKDSAISNYNLNKNDIRVFACINGERSVAEIIDISGLDRIEAWRSFYVLLNGGIIKTH